MKKYTLILFLFVLLKSLAQDTTEFNFGDKHVIIIGEEKEDIHHAKKKNVVDSTESSWMGFTMDIGINGYMAPNNQISLSDEYENAELSYAVSRSFSFYFTYKSIDLISHRFYLSPGYGITWNGYRFSDDINISEMDDSTQFISSPINYRKYKLRATYLEIPIVFGLRIGSLENPLGIQFGAVGGLRIGSILKQKFTIDDTDFKVKARDDFNLNPFKLDAVVRLTLGNLGLFARYSFTQLFSDGKALELYPFAVGVTLGSFK